MHVVATIIAVVLGLLLIASAFGKFTKNPNIVKALHTGLGVPLSMFPILGTLLLLGGIGVLVGIGVEWISVIATIGVIAYFVLGFLFHVSKKDFKGAPGTLIFLVLAVLELIFRTA